METISKRMPRLCAMRARVVDAVAGGKRSGHADADDVFAADGLDGDDGGEGGIDAAAQTDQDFARSRTCAI